MPLFNEQGIPEILKNKKNWVCWKPVKKKTNQGIKKTTKIPVSPLTGMSVSVTDSNGWQTFDTAKAYALKNNLGIGFCFDGEFTGIDLDDCINPHSSVPLMWANKFNSYQEISQSGNGLHIILSGDSGLERGRKKGNYEIYDKERFFAITGDVYKNRTEIEPTDYELIDEFVSFIDGLQSSDNVDRSQNNVVSIGNFSAIGGFSLNSYEYLQKNNLIDSFEEITEILGNDKFINTWNGNRPDLDARNGGFDTSSYLQSLANYFVSFDWPRQVIVDHLRLWLFNHSDKPDKIDRLDIYQRALYKAMDREAKTDRSTDNASQATTRTDQEKPKADLDTGPTAQTQESAKEKLGGSARADSAHGVQIDGNSRPADEAKEEKAQVATVNALDYIRSKLKTPIKRIIQEGINKPIYSVILDDGQVFIINGTTSIHSIQTWKNIAFESGNKSPPLSKKQWPEFINAVATVIERYINPDDSLQSDVQYHIDFIANRAMREIQESSGDIITAIQEKRPIITTDGHLVINGHDFLNSYNSMRFQKITQRQLCSVLRIIGAEETKILRRPASYRGWKIKLRHNMELVRS